MPLKTNSFVTFISYKDYKEYEIIYKFFIVGVITGIDQSEDYLLWEQKVVCSSPIFLSKNREMLSIIFILLLFGTLDVMFIPRKNYIQLKLTALQ